jgi:sugar phosphate isomerase/epimerase
MNQYIITEDELDNIAELLKRNAIYQSVIDEHLDTVYSHPYQSEWDKMANDVQNKINVLKENGFHGATIGCLEEWVKELRQQAGEP